MHEYLIYGVPVSKETQCVTQLALAHVWDKHVGKPGFFLVEFCDLLFLGEGTEEQPIEGCYDMGTGEIKLAIRGLSKKKTGTPLSVGVGLLAAHECVHKFKHFLGEPLFPSLPQLKDGSYATSSQEEFAWREAVDVIKAIFPKAKGSITASGVIYQIPHKSTYG